MQHNPVGGPAEARRFRDSQNREWRVYERQRDSLGGPVMILVFDSDAALRCVRRYPGNWRELLPEALERLSWTA
jgi:hypothetical protein